jgi:hypothetical protein
MDATDWDKRVRMVDMQHAPTIPLHEDIRQALEMSPAEKLIAGARLFDYACAITAAGIRRQHPSATPEEVLQMLRQRLDWARQWE